MGYHCTSFGVFASNSIQAWEKASEPTMIRVLQIFGNLYGPGFQEPNGEAFLSACFTREML